MYWTPVLLFDVFNVFGCRLCLYSVLRVQIHTVIIKIHCSCDIEDFVETHLCKLCVILRSLVFRVVCPH